MNSRILRILAFFGLALLLLSFSGCTALGEGRGTAGQAGTVETVPVHVKVMKADETELVNETISVARGETAYNALTKVATVESEQYAIGKFITAIAGVKPSSDEYWAFYIDGNYAQVGADGFIIEEETELLFIIEGLSESAWG